MCIKNSSIRLKLFPLKLVDCKLLIDRLLQFLSIEGIRGRLQILNPWSPVNKIDNLNRDFFVLCHD
ncbi:hypothetical protein F8276_15590 [Lactiplantibacillus plantarum]|nr:hypothetical protein F8276_15590 [Lactiplantibacillus plantarum]